MEPIRNVKDSDKKDDDIYKTFINENGITSKPEEEEEERSHNSSNKEDNDKDTNDSISKVKKENNPKKNDTNIISQNKDNPHLHFRGVHWTGLCIPFGETASIGRMTGHPH